MKTSVLLNILIILLMFSSFSVEAEKDSEAIQQRMAAVERALQQMAEISTQGAQTVQRLGENVEKLTNDYAVFKSGVSQRLALIEEELEKLKLLQQKPLAIVPSQKNENAMEQRHLKAEDLYTPQQLESIRNPVQIPSVHRRRVEVYFTPDYYYRISNTPNGQRIEQRNYIPPVHRVVYCTPDEIVYYAQDGRQVIHGNYYALQRRLKNEGGVFIKE